MLRRMGLMANGFGTTRLTASLKEQRRAEKERKAAAARIHDLYNNSPCGYHSLDRDGVFVEINDTELVWLGVSREEMIGKKKFSDFLTEESRNIMAKNFPRFKEAGFIKDLEFDIIRGDGAVMSVLLSATAVTDAGGDYVASRSVLMDITDRKIAENALRETTAAAEAANRAKSVFLAKMSHEIRTPMNAILGFAQILQQDADLSAQQRDGVRIINRAGEHLLALINDILEVSRIEAGRVSLHPVSFNLQNLLDDLERMFRSRADAKGLQLIVERQYPLPRYIHADEHKLRQIFINLLGNAIKFTETGGVAVRVRCDRGSEAATARLVVEIEDTGPGIDDQFQEKIFHPFEQTDEGVKAGGTGLGLSISRAFARMMDGDITVRSAKNRGSCFRLEIMAQLSETAEIKKTPETIKVVGMKPRPGGARVLVVDDNAHNRALLRAMLQPVGFDILEAADGREALEAVADWEPHAVLMDMRMPVMDGYEATRRLKSTAAGRNIPIIAVTASAFDDSEKQVMRAGVDAYIRKPFRTKEIFEILGRFLGLEYIHDDKTSRGDNRGKESERITPEHLSALPGDLLEAMREALEEGDMTRLSELIKGTDQLDDAVAERLMALADQYDYQKLGDLLLQRAADY